MDPNIYLTALKNFLLDIVGHPTNALINLWNDPGNWHGTLSQVLEPRQILGLLTVDESIETWDKVILKLIPWWRWKQRNSIFLPPLYRHNIGQ